MIIDNRTVTNAEELVEAVQEMVRWMSQRPEAVYLKTNARGEGQVYLSLEENLLTDGSKTYNIIIR